MCRKIIFTTFAVIFILSFTGFSETIDKSISFSEYIENRNLEYIRRTVISGYDRVWDRDIRYIQPITTERTLDVREGRGRLFDRDLPFNTHLTIDGLKTVRLTLTHKRWRNRKDSDYRKDDTDINIDQSLRVRVTGKIGESVNVNIDYDDSKDDQSKQKLSIVYDGQEKPLTLNALGQPENIIKFDAAFGDIALALPGTEFVSYNRQLFGLRAGMQIRDVNFSGIQLNNFRANFIASRTKGEPGFIEFTDRRTKRISQVRDINYIRRTYYQITEMTGNDTPTIVPFSEKIYIDDRNPHNNEAQNAVEMSGSNIIDAKNDTITYTGMFYVLEPGQDYSINYRTGVVRFRRSISDNDVIMVSYNTQAGNQTENKIIRLRNDYDYDEPYFKYELKNRYNIGATNILVDDPNFIVEIQDVENDRRTTIDVGGSEVSLLHIFGLDNYGYNPDGIYDRTPDGNIDLGSIDSERGIIVFPDTLPFISAGKRGHSDALNNPSVYTRNQEHRYLIYIEYQTEVHQYFLNAFNIVENSEVVRVDGVVMTRNVDYYIDYQTGFLVFLNPGVIQPNSRITVNFERIPFGISAERTLLGARFESQINDNLFLGSTFLLNRNDKANEMPDLNNTPVSLGINSINTRANLMPFLDRTLNLMTFNYFDFETPKSLIQMELTGEIAKSKFDPNTYGKAILDNMQHIKDMITLPISKNFLPSYIPQFDTEVRGRIWFDVEDNKGHEIEVGTTETQRSVKIDYEFDEGDTWIAFRHPISRSGINISQKTRFEMWMKGLEKDNLSVHIEIGTITECIAGDGVLYTEDRNNNGILDRGEDVGITVAGVTYGRDNGILDSADMAGDGVLNEIFRRSEERIYKYHNIQVHADTYFEPRNGWTFYSFNLFDFLPEGFTDQNADSTLIRHIRIWFENTDPSQKMTGTIYTDYVAIVGNKWETEDNTDESFYAIPVNNKDNPDRYRILPQAKSFRNFDSNRDGEFLCQALEIVWNNLQDTKWVEYDLTRAVNISDYGKLNFFVRNYNYPHYNGDETVYLRFGDLNNYFMYGFKIPDHSEWQEVSIDLNVFRREIFWLMDNETAPYSHHFKDNYYVHGNPNMNNINKLRFKVAPADTGISTGGIHVNELHLADVTQKIGVAQKVSISGKAFDNFMTFNGYYLQRDNTFQQSGEVTSTTAQAQVPEQTTQKVLNSSMNLHQLTPNSWGLSMPATISLSETKREVSPDEVQNVERDRLGKTETANRRYTLGIRKNKYPTLNFSFSEKEEDRVYRDVVSEELVRNFQSRADYNYSMPRKPLENVFLLKDLPVIRAFTFGERFDITTYYQYNYDLDEKNFITGPHQDVFNRYITHDRRVSLLHRPFSWITLKPGYKWMEKYQKTRAHSGLRDESFTADLDIDFAEFFGIRPATSFSVTKNLNYDIANQNLDPTENISGSGRINIELTPEKMWQRLNFFRVTFNTNANYTENLKTRQIPQTKDANVSGAFSLRIPTNLDRLWKPLKFLDLTYSFKNELSARYADLSPDVDFKDVITDYFTGNILSFTKKKASTDTESELTLQRRNASVRIDHNFSGRLMFWDPLSLRYNVSYSDNTTQTDNSETFNRNFSSNLNGSLNLRQINLFTNTQTATLTNDYVYSTTTQPNSKTVNFNPRVGLQINWSNIFRTGVDLPMTTSKTENYSSDQTTTVKSYTISPVFRWSYLLNRPFDIEHPTQSHLLRFKNRLELNGTISAAINRRRGVESQRVDTVNYGITGGLTWDAHDNFRLNGSLNFNHFTDKVRDGMDYMSYGLSVYGELRF